MQPLPLLKMEKRNLKKKGKKKEKERERKTEVKSVKLIASNRGEGGRELDLSKILTSKRKKKGK